LHYGELEDSIADPDPGSGIGGFLTPGSRIRNRFSGSRIPNPYFSELGVVAIVWAKNTTILCELPQIFFCTFSKINKFFYFVIFVAAKNGRTTEFFPFLFCSCCWIWARDG
jgi:hypothetical protein